MMTTSAPPVVTVANVTANEPLFGTPGSAVFTVLLNKVWGATVTVRNTATSTERSATTGSNGQYTIPAVPPGLYELTATKHARKLPRVVYGVPSPCGRYSPIDD